LIYDNQINNLLVDFFLGISPPCGNLEELYASRTKPVSEYYLPSD
jgi:hypothetical protein